jgi:hypothetical protein
MPFVFIIVGLVFLVTAIRGTQSDMLGLVKSEFVGKNSFIPWASAILILGALGYVKTIRPVTDGMIMLVVLAMVLANKGGFASALNNQIRNPIAPATPSAGGFTPAGAAMASGVTLQPATANADAASFAQGQTIGELASPSVTTPAVPWYQRLFGTSPAY